MNWTNEKRNCRNYQDLSTYDFGYEIDSLTKLENLKKNGVLADLSSCHIKDTSWFLSNNTTEYLWLLLFIILVYHRHKIFYLNIHCTWKLIPFDFIIFRVLSKCSQSVLVFTYNSNICPTNRTSYACLVTNIYDVLLHYNRSYSNPTIIHFSRNLYLQYFESASYLANTWLFQSFFK